MGRGNVEVQAIKNNQAKDDKDSKHRTVTKPAATRSKKKDAATNQNGAPSFPNLVALMNQLTSHSASPPKSTTNATSVTPDIRKNTADGDVSVSGSFHSVDMDDPGINLNENGMPRVREASGRQ